jgi:hypothetical protein
MKKKISLLIVFFGILFSSNAQVFDLTTGTSAIGTTDPIWTMQAPGGGAFGAVNVSTGSLQSAGGTIYPNAYAQNNCGRWISPWTNAANHIITTPGTLGTFTYRMTFTVDDCVQNPTAVLDLSFMAADDVLNAIRVNGTAQTLPGGTITFNPPSSMTSTPGVVNGVNTIEVDVINNSIYTALQLCGNITVTGDNVAPTNLDCCEALSGEVLSWGSVPGAISYQVVIQWNDPDCCESTQLPTESLYNVTGNSFVLPTPTVCHSWKVRAVFANNCYSDFSVKQCGCYPIKGKCKAPTELNCDADQNGIYLSWGSTGVTYYEIEINYNDPACCNNGELQFTNTFSTLSNSFTVSNPEACFSWRVRSICKDGSRSAWSVYKCSCGFGQKQEEGNIRSNSIQGKDVKVTLMPNPAEESVTIMVLNPAVTENCELVILDLSGSVVHSSSIKMNEENRIDLTSFKPGMYICNVNADGKIISTDKLVIK